MTQPPRRPRLPGNRRRLFLAFSPIAALVFFAGWHLQSSYRGERVKEVIVEEIVYEKPPLPTRAVDYADTPDDVVRLYNGLRIRTTMDAGQGKRATLERQDAGAYEIEYKLKLRVPRPSESLGDLAGLNQHLPKILPGLASMIPEAKVSGFYHKLYDLKVQRVKTYLTRLRRVPSRHNFFDCETVLELQHPESGQRVLLIQGEMDVVSDGSDGDRMPRDDDYVPESQPLTSYGWPKRTRQPNPHLPRWEEKLAAATARGHTHAIATLKREIADLKARSFLIARTDPFVVIPTSFLGYQRGSKFAPTIGDYCVVIYRDKVYPAILGDAGPTYKMGEASLRMAKTINEKASPYSRPVTELTVTYLVFPQSRDKPFGPPDLEKWHRRCQQYLGKIGGLGEDCRLHAWEDLFAPKEREGEPDGETRA